MQGGEAAAAVPVVAVVVAAAAAAAAAALGAATPNGRKPGTRRARNCGRPRTFARTA